MTLGPSPSEALRSTRGRTVEIRQYGVEQPHAVQPMDANVPPISSAASPRCATARFAPPLITAESGGIPGKVVLLVGQSSAGAGGPATGAGDAAELLRTEAL